ncbi:MAG: glycosyltransferase [Planctomycetales bacterium]|nr:glycosyltransferase [Planctomycetales bacterium]
MHICHLAKYYAPFKGGIETHVRTLAHTQAQRGAKVKVICVDHASPASWGRRISSEYDGQVEVVRVPRWASVSRFDVCRGLRRMLVRECNSDWDILHLHTPNPTMMMSLVGLSCQAPLVVSHHSDVVRQKILYQGLRLLENSIYTQAQAVLASSEAYVAGSQLLGRFQQKVQVCPYGIDVSRFQEGGSQSGETFLRMSALPKPLWLMVGRLVYYKGHEIAIRALRHVPGTLVIAGAGPLKSRIMQEAKRLQVADRIVLEPNMDDESVVGAYRAATALWFPSTVRSESFGLVQVEAMAAGCPVINCQVADSGVASVSHHHESGITVRPKDPIEFAAAANELDRDKELRRSLAEGARRRAFSLFHKDTMADRCFEIYQSLGAPGHAIRRAA